MVHEWLEWYAAGGASPGTIRIRRCHMLRLVAVMEPLTATEADLAAFLASHVGLKPESRKSMQASLRSFYAWAASRGLIESNPSSGLRNVRTPPGVPRPIAQAALRQALADAGEEATLMLLLGAYAGLRRSEIARVHSDDFDGLALTVLGKGGRVRRVPTHPMLGGRLAQLDGWAFPSPVRVGQPVTADFVSDRLGRVLPSPYTPHSLRHYFGTMAYRGSHDLRAVQTLLGHARPETTARYVLVDEDSLTAAVLAVA